MMWPLLRSGICLHRTSHLGHSTLVEAGNVFKATVASHNSAFTHAASKVGFNQSIWKCLGGLRNCARSRTLLIGSCKTSYSSFSKPNNCSSRFHIQSRISTLKGTSLFRRQLSKLNSKYSEQNTLLKSGSKASPPPKTSDISRLLSLAKPEKWKLIGAVALLLISSGVTMVVPFGIGRVIDIIYTHAQDGHMIERLRYFCQVLLAVFILGALANFGRIYLMSISGNRIIKRLRELIFGSIVKQEMAFFDKNKTGELINRLSADTSIVGQAVTSNISDGLRSTTQALGGISMMVYMSPKLALISMGIVPPLFLLTRVYGRYVQKITRQVQDSLAESTQIAQEKLGNMRTVRAFSQEEMEQNIYNQKIDHVLKLSYKESMARGVFWGLTGLSGNVMILSVFYYGGVLMKDAQITVGELSSFLLYAAFVGVSLSSLTGFYTELMRGLGASSRLWQLADRKTAIPLTDGKVLPKEILGNVDFRNIYFHYPTRTDSQVFSDLSLSVPQGTVMAVVGASGSGKSTLASLILRYYDTTQGSIYFDGTDIRELNPSWLRGHIGLVSQEPVLFSSSIADNIAYGAVNPSSVTQDQIIEASKMANAYNFIQLFPQQFDTLVGERGVMLSGGQKQRIAIARAILKNPKILLLDEATSALDAESEYLVQEALERVMVGRTVITIAHRLSTIRNADQIAVLDQGQVAELGSYQKLMTIPNGLFRKLVERQTIEP